MIGSGLGSGPNRTLRGQAPGYFRMIIGDLEITSIYDGFVDVDRNLLTGKPAEDLFEILDKNYFPADRIATSNSNFVIDDGHSITLIDAGTGSFFGASMGRNVKNLEAAGFDLQAISKVLLTHAHPDHICGLVSGDEKTFPNATIYVAKTEYDYWTDPAAWHAAPEEMRPVFAEVQKAVKPYREADQLVAYEYGEIHPGIVARPLQGHSPGHSGYEFGTTDGDILFWGDIVHNHVLQFADPGVSVELDQDIGAARETRERIIKEAADRRLLIGGAHLPFPALGRVVQTDRGFGWRPVEFGPTIAPQDVVHLKKH